MEKLFIGAKKAINKVLYGISKLFVNFNKKINGVRKSETFYPIIDRKENNLQVCYPVVEYKRKSLPVIFYFHGGGWLEYDKCYYFTFCKRLAKMGYIVCNVNYVLAPKYSLKEIIHDCIETIINAKEYLEYNYNADTSKIILAGDSAGAHISAIIAGLDSSGKIKDIYPEFSKVNLNVSETLLFYGVYDLESVLKTGFPSIELYVKSAMKEDYLIPERMQEMSPINYVTNKFPRTFIASGETDKLHLSQSKVFLDSLRQLGVDVEYLFFDKEMATGMHGFIAFDDFKSNSKTREEIEKFLNKTQMEAE